MILNKDYSELINITLEYIEGIDTNNMWGKYTKYVDTNTSLYYSYWEDVFHGAVNEIKDH